MTDPIADMLTRIRNGLSVHQAEVIVPYSGVKQAILAVLKAEAYIDDFEVSQTFPKTIRVKLRYRQGKPVITQLKRLSKPGRRLYVKAKNLPPTLGGYGLTIVTTSQGIMSEKTAKTQKLGGEVICQIY